MRINKNSLMNSVGKESVEEQLNNLKKLYELVGISEDEINQKISNERQAYEASYAYLIMHNTGMSLKEKRKYIFRINPTNGRRLFWSNYVLYLKENFKRIY